MTETVSEGDLVEAVKGERFVRDRVKRDGEGDLYLKGVGHFTNRNVPTKDANAVAANGYAYTVIEKAAPKIELPTEPGYYINNSALLVYRLHEGTWSCNGDPTDTYYSDFMELHVKSYGDLVKLEPRAITAKAVIQSIQQRFDATGAPVERLLTHAANEFNVVPA